MAWRVNKSLLDAIVYRMREYEIESIFLATEWFSNSYDEIQLDDAFVKLWIFQWIIQINFQINKWSLFLL